MSRSVFVDKNIKKKYTLMCYALIFNLLRNVTLGIQQLLAFQQDNETKYTVFRYVNGFFVMSKWTLHAFPVGKL